jgi:Mrp family chromosome partitioning ATPase
MSQFSRAIEQAERDRAALRATAGPPAAVAGEAPRAAMPRLDEIVAQPSEAVEEHLVSLLQPASVEAERYRTLRHLVEQARRTVGLAVVGISSPVACDGKTLTAINLAGALAQAPGSHVLLVDLDLRKPEVAHQLGLDAAEDNLIHALLKSHLTLEQVVRRCPPFGLAVLPSHRSVNATYELLKSPRCGELIAEARERYDYVVVDLPPLIPTPDCRIVEKWLDGFVVIVAAHKTPRKVLEEALAAVDPAKVVGLVFNGDDSPSAGYAYTPTGDGIGWWRRIFASGRHRRGQRFKAVTTRSSTDR